MDLEKPAGRRVSPAWAKEDLEVSEEEVTLRGWEERDDMRTDTVIIGVDEYAKREQYHSHELQNRALIGLGLVLLEVLIIVAVLASGVAEAWFSERFAEFVLASTVPSSVTAWMYIVRRTFPAGK
jgi:hypothetical protein